MTFVGAGSELGLTIWRIEDFEAKPIEKSNYGKFYAGDSYIVLSTTQRGKGSYSWDIHFWLGSETSLDEAGTAAIKAVELDESLGGRAVQHREVQSYEGSLFISYFKTGVKYLPGGVKSGFVHVDPESEEKRLFQVKGKRDIKVQQVPLDASSMNNSDCFILDCGKSHDILVYAPKGARRVEKLKAVQAANEIKDEDHAGKGKVEVIDEYSDEPSTFFEALGSGSADSIKDSSSEDDEIAEKRVKKSILLYQVVAEADGNIAVTEVSGSPLTQDMLKSGDCFILLPGNASVIFVWIGKEASKEERIQAMKSGEAFLEKFNLPKWTKIERIVDGGETASFKQYFKTWKEQSETAICGFRRTYSSDLLEAWNILCLHNDDQRRLAKSGGEAFGFMPDDGSGTKEIFRIQDFELVPLDLKNYGFFFGGDSYVIKYTYEIGSKVGHIIYFWQGGQSSSDEKAAAALNALKLDNDLGGKAVQVRVIQGREPRHFIKMFAGKMVVLTGGKASGFNNIHDHDTYDNDGIRMFCVRGTGPDDVRAVQVEEKSSSLNSEDVFILETPTKTFIWKGQCSNDDELNHAVAMTAIVSPGHPNDVIQEGSESDDFWLALGGKGDYSISAIHYDKPVLDPRLFHCRILGTKMIAIEVHNFEKQDLASEDVMMLDSGDEVYIWIGSEATNEEKEKALQLAEDYISTDPTDRDLTNTLIFNIKEGEEPSSFTCLFPSF